MHEVGCLCPSVVAHNIGTWGALGSQRRLSKEAMSGSQQPGLSGFSENPAFPGPRRVLPAVPAVFPGFSPHGRLLANAGVDDVLMAIMSMEKWFRKRLLETMHFSPSMRI